MGVVSEMTQETQETLTGGTFTKHVQATSNLVRDEMENIEPTFGRSDEEEKDEGEKPKKIYPVPSRSTSLRASGKHVFTPPGAPRSSKMAYLVADVEAISLDQESLEEPFHNAPSH
ncbi:unnamed protein product [Phyllotreta striolata]|uniref:Uncharacterized protein n=1 Tax=Phyllotreta striolata TaxID=444603 RepID=A0A9N9TWL3_PHYSR|nr:unnamed protein product [Phyllotreta striolata]